jgi:uroporphyrinogen decarboxylase
LASFWAEHLAEYGVAQHEAGAAAVQVFDSWAGTLGPVEYERYVLPHVARMFQRLREAGVPSIHFSIGNPALLPLIGAAGSDAVSVDWRLPIDEAWRIVGEGRAIQGNLDPAILLAGKEPALRATREILERVGGRPGHIFNLGHGLLPATDWEVVRAVAEYVHEHD